MELTHLSLFTGIGGLDLAAEWAGFTTVGQCEWADYPTKVLEKHWPEVPRWRDVRELSADEFYRRTGRRTVDCISGGFPCQPHSLAGKRKASCDDRDLWPEFRRVIGEIKPKWVVGENVLGLLSSESGRFFGRILRDLAEMGYDAAWCVTSAAEVGAVHRRERVAIIANTREQRVDGGGAEKISRKQTVQRGKDCGSVEKWRERSNLYEPKLLRNYYGVPNGVDRIKCLGNAVVPQQFYPIFKAIAELEAGQ